MIISNLNHLDVVAERISIINGGKLHSGASALRQTVTAWIPQKAFSDADGSAYKGDAIACSTAVNNIIIKQN